MKRVLFVLMIVVAVFTACKDPNSTPNPNPTVPGDKIVVNEDIKANVTWTANNQYLIDGPIHVKEGFTLTIEPGTIIKGNTSSSWLVIERGAKLMAEGTKDKPIVFTSNKPAGDRAPGDWAGIQICGYGVINNPAGEAEMEGGTGAKFGGTNNADNSGILKYVRIEFAGYEVSPGNELNGLSMGAVGSGTTLEYIQISYGKDDSFEWWGGAVNAKYLISFRGGDDDFDTDWGYCGKLQYGLAVRHADQHDASDASNGFESDNDSNGTANEPFTKAVFSNFTLVGPLTTVDAQVPTQHGNGLRLRRNTEVSLFNSAIVGWVNGVMIEGPSAAKFLSGALALQNNQIAGCRTNFKDGKDGITAADLETAWLSGSNNNSIKTIGDMKFVDGFNYTKNGWMPQSGSSLLSGAAFSNGKLTGFEPTTFVGAFGTTDWTTGWAEFNPVNANYEL